MEATSDSGGTLLLWSIFVVLGHFAVVIWHLFLLVRVQPNTPGFLPPLLIAINLIPIAGLLAFVKGFPRLAAICIATPLAVALVAGVSAHFLNSGPDNVLNMPPVPLRLPYQISATLLVLLEATGCWLGIRMFAASLKSRTYSV